MIKEKLMKALKTAAADYNGGMGANMAVACAADAWDFNEKQAERLTEMFNTAVALEKQKDSVDPTGSCELASKEAVAKILLNGLGQQKAASATHGDYSFYGSDVKRTNPTMEARLSGSSSMLKAAAADVDTEPAELKVSQRSLYKIIEGKIDLLKSASAAADDVVRNLKLEIERDSVKIAKAIEDPFADATLADMFKAACHSLKAVANVAEYSSKVAESTGGSFAGMNVFDASPVEDLLKIAETIEDNMGQISEYEKKRDFYLSKAAEAQDEMREAVGLAGPGEEDAGLAGMFHGVLKKADAVEPEDCAKPMSDTDMCMKIAELIRRTGVSADEVARLAEDMEKDSAVNMGLAVPMPKIDEAHGAMVKFPGIDSERKRIMNIRRSILLADLMSNDPIIRDADPNVVVEAYKTMVMTSPRVSLDKSQARAFLRSAVNSVAISPADAKIIADVDKGMSLSNVDRLDRLTKIDSSVKDSNE